MRRLLLAMCLVSLYATGAAAAEEPLVVEARAFEAKLMTAVRGGDRATLAPILADGFVFIHSTGPVESREEYLAHISGAGVMLQRSELVQSDEAWRAFGSDTVIRQAKVSMRNKATGAEVRARNINVYVRGAKGWQWASSQSTKLPMRPHAVAVDVQAAGSYVGTYAIDREHSLVVTQEGDVLFAVITGRSKAELVPTSATTFVLFNEENDLGFLELSFSRDDKGRPVAATMRANGQLAFQARRSP